jgi:hypothetical protein
METISTLYPATAEKAAIVRANLKSFGVLGARVRRMDNGSLRIVLASKYDREAARDAFILSDACTASGEMFTSPSSSSAYNGDTEIFVRFTRA